MKRSPQTSLKASFAILQIIFALVLSKEVLAQKTTRINTTSLCKAVESDINNTRKHQLFIDASWGKDTDLINQYNMWVNKYPRSPIVPLMIGKHLGGKGEPESIPFLIKAVKLDASLDTAWYLVAKVSQNAGNDSIAVEYISKAGSLKPDKELYALQKVLIKSANSPEIFEEEAFKFIRKFPSTESAVFLLQKLAQKEDNLTIKISYYEILNSMFKDEAGSALEEYFELLLDTLPGKAFELATEKYIHLKTNHGIWGERRRIAEAFAKVRDLEKRFQYAEAITLLNGLELGHYPEKFEIIKQKLIVCKSKILDADGQTQPAYESLCSLYATSPGYSLRTKLFYYGYKIGKDTITVMKEINQMRRQTSIEASDQSFTELSSSKALKISDLRGRMILLSHWFPGCYPCIAEFPFFEYSLKKLDRDQIVYLGVNGEIKQDDLVLPLIHKRNYSFTPLITPKKYEGNLKPYGFPTNFLIDQDGKIILKNFRVDNRNKDMLELLVSELITYYNK
ncbi:TlpA family protein disulfide reductase [Desertivirga brevis]|uniref:TlpA family protein disulfide reductase n=1 Tax=Desertivirga brevis TaxID=2810310 RepID=UPI001A956827|nr:TlpA family protein disulfide reductase [Pedobacter sp. SYSU D00873]